MATARTFIHAAPEDIFNVLSNPGFTSVRDRECLRRLRRLAER